MRITIEIDENSLREVQKATGESKKSPAVQKAVEAFLREQRKREILERVLSGKTNYQRSNEELEAMAEYDSYDSD